MTGFRGWPPGWATASVRSNGSCWPIVVLAFTRRLLHSALQIVRCGLQVGTPILLCAKGIEVASLKTMSEIATELDSTARQSNAVDLILHKADKWHGYNTFCPAAIAALIRR